MKNRLLKSVLSVLAFATSAFATAIDEDKPVSPQYDHRMVVFHPSHLGYEYMPNDDLYIGVEMALSGPYRVDTDEYPVIGHAEIKFGRSTFIDGRDHIRPFLGAGFMRDFTEKEEYSWQRGSYTYVQKDKNPTIAYGLIGFTAERDFNTRFSLGGTLKTFMGGVAGNKYNSTRDLYYGLDFSIPITIRLGESRNWDLRLEPYALVINDGSRYIGHRSAFAYRF